MNKPVTYKDAGVDIDAGNALVDRIKPAVSSTTRNGSMGGIGGFGGLFDLKACGYKDPILVSATDGVGTKLAIAQAVDKHDTIGIDLVAMCVNDLIVQGAEPLFFLDYFATGKLSVDEAASVVEGIAKGCLESGCALVGGETAEMPSMYDAGKYDLAGFSVGAVERDAMLPKADIKPGDVVLGLASSGLHSNGFSLVRHIIKETLLNKASRSVDRAALSASDQRATSCESQETFTEVYKKSCPWDAAQTLGEALLIPTRIYVKPLLDLLRSDVGSGVKGLAHITGGGLSENIPRILPDGVGVKLNKASWQRPAVFDWLQEAGNMEDAEMLRTLNSGIGMVIIVDSGNAEAIATQLTQAGEQVSAIGEVVVKSGEVVTYHG